MKINYLSKSDIKKLKAELMGKKKEIIKQKEILKVILLILSILYLVFLRNIFH